LSRFQFPRETSSTRLHADEFILMDLSTASQTLNGTNSQIRNAAITTDGTHNPALSLWRQDVPAD